MIPIYVQGMWMQRLLQGIIIISISIPTPSENRPHISYPLLLSSTHRTCVGHQLNGFKSAFYDGTPTNAMVSSRNKRIEEEITGKCHERLYRVQKWIRRSPRLTFVGQLLR